EVQVALAEPAVSIRREIQREIVGGHGRIPLAGGRVDRQRRRHAERVRDLRARRREQIDAAFATKDRRRVAARLALEVDRQLVVTEVRYAVVVRRVELRDRLGWAERRRRA